MSLSHKEAERRRKVAWWCDQATTQRCLKPAGSFFATLAGVKSDPVVIQTFLFLDLQSFENMLLCT